MGTRGFYSPPSHHGYDEFFATVWFHTPHEPVVAGEEYKKPYAKFGQARQNYYGCITAMDEQIGRLRGKLSKLEELETSCRLSRDGADYRY